MNNKFTEEVDKIIRDNYPEHGSPFCVKKLNFVFKNSDIIAYCARKGIKRNKNFNIEIFKKVTNPKMAYLLGLLWADGASHKNGTRTDLEVVKTDGIIFYEIIKELGKFGISERIRKNRTKTMMTISIHSSEITRYLRGLGFDDKSKKSPIFILNTISENLHRYFWLGYFDGDGCFYIKERMCQASFAGAITQDWAELSKFLHKIECKFTISKVFERPHNKNESSALRITSRFDIYKLGNYLYQNYDNDKIGLPRKYKKFLEIREKVLNSKRKPSCMNENKELFQAHFQDAKQMLAPAVLPQHIHESYDNNRSPRAPG